MKIFYGLLITAILLTAAVPSFAYDLSWQESATNETGIKVYRKLPTEPGFSLLVTLPANTTSYSDPMRVVDTCYEVALFNDFGESSHVKICATGPDGSVTILVVK